MMFTKKAPPEHFRKSGNRFSDKKCGNNKEIEPGFDSIKTGKALALSLALMAGIAVLGMSPLGAAEKKPGDTVTDPVEIAAGKNAAIEAALTRMSSEGFAAMQAIKVARLAIFEGKPGMAEKMVALALKKLEAAARDETKYAVKTKMALSGSAVAKLVPIDGAMFVADNFTVTPEKKDKIAKANSHFKKGESKKAIETLRLASIDVALQRVIMPVGRTIEHVKAAADLLRDQKYYQANLALKAAEDGLIVDTVELVSPVGKDKKSSK